MLDSDAAPHWGNPQLLATPLLLLGVDRYGPEALHWLPDTWRHEVYQDSRVELPDGCLDRLALAALLLTQPQAFYRDPARFETTCRLFHSGGFRPQFDGLADARDAQWGVLEAALLHPREPGLGVDWSPAVRAYAQAALRHDGVRTAPAIFYQSGLLARTPPAADPAAAPAGDPAAGAREAGHAWAERDLAESLAAGVDRLRAQLAALPLRHGSTADVVRRLAALRPA